MNAMQSVRNRYLVLGMLVMPLALIGAGIVYGSDVDTPNTFVPGTTVLAAEMNANFAAHEAAIDDNDARLDGLITGGLSGIAKAGAFIDGAGNVTHFFNSFGGQPIVATPTTGFFDVTFPGFSDMSTRIFSVSLIGTFASGIRGTPASGSGSLLVNMIDAAGVSIDSGFCVLIY